MRAGHGVTLAYGLAASMLAVDCAHVGAPATDERVPTSVAALPHVDAGTMQAADAGPAFESEAESRITDDCVKKAFVRVVLGDDRAQSVVEWIRCGVPEPRWSDGGEALWPRDRVVLTAPDGTRTVLFSNAGEESEVGFDYLRVLDLAASAPAPRVPRARQLVYSVQTYGTGNIHDWRIVDRHDGMLREWKVDNYFGRWAPLLRQGEDVRKQLEYGVTFDGGRVVVSGLVYAASDANCCPSGGAIYAELVPGDGILHVGKVWRAPLP